MPLASTEVIVGAFPKNTNGVRNEFIEISFEMLRDANIPARIATLSEVGPEHKPSWAREQGDWEPLFIIVPQDCLQQAWQVKEGAAGTVRICVQCEAYIKPGATKCPRCGVADERDPAQLQAKYGAALQKHLSDKEGTSTE